MKAFMVAMIIAGLCALAWMAVLGRQLVAFEASGVVVCEEPCTFQVEPGQTAGDVLEAMHASGIVPRVPQWPLWVSVRKPGGCLQAGVHALRSGMTPTELFDALCATGTAPERTLVVPEGTNLFELSDLLVEQGYGDRASVEAALADRSARPAGAPPGAPSLEGLLFPDTYRLAEDADAADVIARMTSRASEVHAELFGENADALAALAASHDVDAWDVVILASLVEAEAQVAEERPLIARVFYNRLALGMKLQTDPTCVYSPTRYTEVPTREACRDPQNHWSTYVIEGLPPGPINNPGRAALEAALEPADDPNVLYFVAMRDGTGRHAFASTLAEHEANVDRYLR